MEELLEAHGDCSQCHLSFITLLSSFNPFWKECVNLDLNPAGALLGICESTFGHVAGANSGAGDQ